ncbi:dehydrogenase/reductase SDR family member 11 [Anabrus simplex]|uniref:dehydrogenase/reductase SDR family member 11 n=1 Tax=Anabrus simplex TaxID=316456 RepID=UPI0034DD9591
MERWSGRVALVTGASAGIGAAIAKELVNHGMQVVGLARRDDKVKELAAQCENAPGKLYAFQGDISKKEDVIAAFNWIKDNLGGVDVLVNNAGMMHESNLHDGEVEEWRQILEVNVLGLSLCTREAVQSMRERGVDDGYIVNISSVLGHIISGRDGIGMYNASKHAVRVLSESIRRELVSMGSRIRISSISPGVVKTSFFDRNATLTPDKLFQEAHVLPEDVVDAVIYVLSRPDRVQIQDMIIRATGTTY